MKKAILLVATCGFAVTAHADDVGTVFQLGQVNASASAPSNEAVGGTTITQDDVREFNRETLDKAIQLVPGASVSEVGARNETDIWIRGFDRFRVPLSIDGIPVYLPADNRIDFSRFSTSEYSEIQVSKGFTSVIDGPGALGGAVNLVSRKVTQPFEGDGRIGFTFDGNGAHNGELADVFVGTKQDLWYAQVAATIDQQTHYRLSDSYSPSTLENGGNRDHSFHQDYSFNVKAGYTPNSSDEYSLNVIDQVGQKDNPTPDSLISNPATQKYWTWPNWDKQSVYFISKTAIDDAGSYLQIRAYGDRFYNVLDSFDTAAYTTQNLPKSFNSYYDDYAAGTNIELSEALLDGADNLKFAFHYRWDQHNAEEATVSKANGVFYSQPWLQDSEDTYSGAIENTYHPTTQWDVTAGVSYDYRHMVGAQDFDTYTVVPANPPFGYIVNYPVGDNHAINPELLVAYHLDDKATVHASVSERTRFPTLFEMFSSRFGTFTGNPYLKPETSDNIEAGITETIGLTKLGANAFYSRVRDAIGSVAIVFPAPVGATNQNQNVGTELHEGFELEASSQVLPSLELGGNYSYLERENLNHFAVATDTPKHKLFLYANWQPLAGLFIVPSVEFDSKRTLQNANVTTIYYRGGDFAVLDLKAAYQVNPRLEIEVGAKNLTDENYEIEDGYHAEGRNFFSNVRYKF